jgi:hypothetical protein
MPIEALSQLPFDNYISRLTANDPSLTELDFSDAHLSEESLQVLKAALMGNQYLVELNLTSCGLSLAAFYTLLELLSENPIIDTLILNDNRLTALDGDLLINMLAGNDAIIELSVEGNYFSALQRSTIRGMLAFNLHLASMLEAVDPSSDTAPIYDSVMSVRQEVLTRYQALSEALNDGMVADRFYVAEEGSHRIVEANDNFIVPQSSMTAETDEATEEGEQVMANADDQGEALDDLVPVVNSSVSTAGLHSLKCADNEVGADCIVPQMLCSS